MFIDSDSGSSDGKSRLSREGKIICREDSEEDGIGSWGSSGDPILSSII